ncbi:MAG: hypothetical protein WKF40_03805 [Thermoleophilaceae bacterium]
MTHSHKNLRDVRDTAPDAGFSEVQEARFARGDLQAEDTGLAYHVLRAGKRQAFAHRHEAAEEIYVVLSGTGRMKIDDEILDVGPYGRHPRGAEGGARLRGGRRTAGDTGLRPSSREGRGADQGRLLERLGSS